MNAGRRVTVIVEEFGGAAPGEPGAWEIKASASNNLMMLDNNCRMEELDVLCRNTMADALTNYRSERQRGRKRHGHELLP